MAVYGFKGGVGGDDAATIAGLKVQATSISQTDYQTMAQYRIKDVTLNPQDVNLGLPRRWQLRLDTELLGMNRPDNRPLWFQANDKTKHSDGKLEYDLTQAQFAKMTQGGLYNHPKNYINNLQKDLTGETFFRPTKATLTEIMVPTTSNTIMVGDLRPKLTRFKEFLVGSDLQTNVDFSNDKNLAKQSDLDQVINRRVDNLAKRPVISDEKINLETDPSFLQQFKQTMQHLLHPKTNSKTDVVVNDKPIGRATSSKAPKIIKKSNVTFNNFDNESDEVVDSQSVNNDSDKTLFNNANHDSQTADTNASSKQGAESQSFDPRKSIKPTADFNLNDLMRNLNESLAKDDSSLNAPQIPKRKVDVVVSDDYATALKQRKQRERMKMQRTVKQNETSQKKVKNDGPDL